MKAAIVLFVTVIITAADDSGIYEDFVKASNAFATDLYKEASKKEKGNILASPLSLELVLALTATGAYGDTQEEILQALHVPQEVPKVQGGYRDILSTIDTSSVDIATQLFLGKEFKVDKRFAKQAQEHFKSAVQNVDFTNAPDEAVKTINDYISQKTNGKVQEIVPTGSVDQTTKLLLINSLFFKAKWNSPFKTEMTRKGSFYLSNDKTKSVSADLMYQAGNFKYLNVEEFSSQMVELPFQGNKYKMVIMLPNEIEGYSTVEAILKDDPHFFVNFEGFEDRKVDITMPKMKVFVNTDFSIILKNLGVKSVFTETADLYGIVENDVGKLLVSSVIQKVCLDVDEAGAEAAVATSTSVSQRRSSEDPITFIADHPFLFAIVQTSNNLVLFQGRFSKPTTT